MTKTIQFTKKNLSEVCAFIGGKSGQRFVARPPGAIGVLLKSKDTKWIKPGDWLVKGRDGWCKVREGELPVKKRECEDCGEDMERHQNLRTCAHCGLKVCGYCYTHRGHHPIFHSERVKCGDNPPPVRQPHPDDKVIVKMEHGGSIAIPRSVMEASGVSSSQAGSGGDMIVDAAPPVHIKQKVATKRIVKVTYPKCQGPTTSLGHSGDIKAVQRRVSHVVNHWIPGTVNLCRNCRDVLNGGWRYPKE